MSASFAGHLETTPSRVLSKANSMPNQSGRFYVQRQIVRASEKPGCLSLKIKVMRWPRETRMLSGDSGNFFDTPQVSATLNAQAFRCKKENLSNQLSTSNLQQRA
jgi:hypothetical protein